MLIYFISSSNTIIPPKKDIPVIALTFKKIVEKQHIIETPISSPVLSSEPKVKEKKIKETSPSPTPPEAAISPSEDTVSPLFPTPLESMTTLEEPVFKEINPNPSGDIIYSDKTDIVFEEAPLVAMEDPSLDFLLMEEGSSETPLGQELYSIAFNTYESRRILYYPDFLLNYSDPVLSTLLNCQITFSITQEGLVENIKMIEPGTGSKTYDKIIEDLMVQLVFEPGWEDRGIIFLNFALINRLRDE